MNHKLSPPLPPPPPQFTYKSVMCALTQYKSNNVITIHHIKMQRMQEVNINTGKFGFHKENERKYKKRNGKFGCVMEGLSVSECVQRESEQLANEGTSVNEGWKVVSLYFCVFIGIFGVRKVQCYLSVQVTVLLEMGVWGWRLG